MDIEHKEEDIASLCNIKVIDGSVTLKNPNLSVHNSYSPINNLSCPVMNMDYL
jgi:hypothetical protein